MVTKKKKIAVIKTNPGRGSGPSKKDMPGKERSGISGFFKSLLTKLRLKKPSEGRLEKAAPKEVKEALREAQREKSKIEGMIKKKGHGWYGDKLRHQKVALKAWQTRKKKEFLILEIKESKKGLSTAERRKKESIENEMHGISEAIKGIEGHLHEINKHRAREQTGEVSMAVMREARKAAEKAAEAAKAMPKHIGKSREAEKKPWAPGLEEIRVGEKNMEEVIRHYKGLIKRVEVDYLKRRISEEEYKKHLSKYRQRLAEAEEKKKALGRKEVGKVKKSTAKPLPRKHAEVKMGVEKQPIPGVQKSRVAKPKETQASAGQKPAVDAGTPKATETLASVVSPQATHQKLSEIEKHITELLQKYQISKSDVEKGQDLDKNRLLQDFDKLINLIELEKETKKMKKVAVAVGPEKIEIPITARKKEKITAMAKEIKKHRIVTDFDRLLNYVREKGKVSAEDARKKLKMEKKHFKECCNVLEENQLLKIAYPAIGRMRLVDINYKEEKKKNNKKKVKKL